MISCRYAACQIVFKARRRRWTNEIDLKLWPRERVSRTETAAEIVERTGELGPLSHHGHVMDQKGIP